MKNVLKTILFVCSFFVTQKALTYSFDIYNNTNGQIEVTLVTAGRSDYVNIISSGGQWHQDTIGYCVSRIKVVGRSGEVAGLYADRETPGTSCQGRIIDINPINRHLDRMYGDYRADGIDIIFAR
jgi:hypothetical protein